ncbi:MAG TPA: hypothetical protein VGR49_02420 [Actinomycetota bacterium]|nr:hypothetical protein [Actinomycetota bacterium]
MIDLEREVREVLEQRAEESAGWSSEHMPERVRGRIRRRQARTVLLSGLAAALVALGALATTRTLFPTADRQPGTEAPTPPPLLEEPTPLTVVASGEFRGQEWKFTAGRDGEIWCFEVKTGTTRRREGMGSCERDPLGHRHLVATALNRRSFPAVVVSGVVSREVDRVVFDFDAGGQIEGRVYAVPGSIEPPPFDVFLIVIPKERPVRGLVLAIDVDGNVLARHGVYETRGLLGLEDVHGNVVGYIPAQPPLWEEWAEPGTRATLERIESIRHVATFPLRDVWPDVREWWRGRPPPEATDDAFLDWWQSYPVGGPMPSSS